MSNFLTDLRVANVSFLPTLAAQQWELNFLNHIHLNSYPVKFHRHGMIFSAIISNGSNIS